MRTVHQVLATAAPADAVTDQALRWAEVLRADGIDGRLVAEHVHPRMTGRVVRLDAGGRELLREGPLLLHYSIWSGAAEAALGAPGPLGLVYHNITPGSLLRAASPEVAALCDRGRAELGRFRGRVAALIADSGFNAAELEETGVGRAEVVPLLLDVPEGRPAGDGAGGDPEAPLILTVGRIAPSKRVEDVLKVVALLQRSRAPRARLVIVGSDEGFEGYRRALGGLEADLGVRDVTWAGRVAPAARDDLYRSCDAYLCMSAHEGFCAPLVEAMAAGAPVVARAAGAVPETLAGGGLAIADEDPAVFAEALHVVTGSPELRAAMAAGAARRLAELAPERVAERIRAAVRPLVGAA